jgi:hypothetical protein
MFTEISVVVNTEIPMGGYCNVCGLVQRYLWMNIVLHLGKGNFK